MTGSSPSSSSPSGIRPSDIRSAVSRQSVSSPAAESQIQALVEHNLLQRVAANREMAQLLISTAKQHLITSKSVLDIDPVGSFQLAYDASRKALSAILQDRGLRATAKGGHRVVEEAVRACLGPEYEEQTDNFGWMRYLRNSSEYPSLDKPTAQREDAIRAHEITAALIDLSEQQTTG